MTMNCSGIFDLKEDRKDTRLSVSHKGVVNYDQQKDHIADAIDEDDIITLNIGGIKFQTFAKTLQRYPATRLAQLNRLDPSFRRKQNEYFFDRNPNSFCSVLDYYRTGELHCPGDGICGSAFKLELEFWGLVETNIEKCCWMDYSDNANMKDTLNELDGRLKEDMAVPVVAQDANTWAVFCHKVWLVMEYPQTSALAKVYTALTVALLLTSLTALALGTCEEFSLPLDVSDVAKIHQLPVDSVNISDDGTFYLYHNYYDDYYDYYYDDYYNNDNENDSLPTTVGPFEQDPAPQLNHTDTEVKTPSSDDEDNQYGNGSNDTNSTDGDYQYHYYDNEANNTLTVNGSNVLETTVKPDLIGNYPKRRKRGAIQMSDSLDAANGTQNPITTTATAVNKSDLLDQNLNALFSTTSMPKAGGRTKPTPKVFDPVGLRKPLKGLWVVELAVYIFFTAEFFVRLITCPSKLRFLRSPFTICDFLSLVPFYIEIILNHFDREKEFKITPADVMSVLRVLRLGRLFSVMMNMIGFRVMVYTLKSSCREMFLLLVVLLFAVFSFATIEYFTEQLTKGDTEIQIESIPLGIWWALVTMTTVGYGDYCPKTGFGLFIGSLCALCGVMVIAFTVPIVVNNFMMFYKHASSLRPKKSGDEYLTSAKKTHPFNEPGYAQPNKIFPRPRPSKSPVSSVRTKRKISVEEFA